MAKVKKEKLSLEEMLEQALVKEGYIPYEVPGNWVWTRLGDIIKVSSGKSLTSAKMVSEGTIPVYGGNGITGYHNAFNIEVSTIVIGRVGFYCGSVHFINENAWVTDNALIVSFSKEKLNIKFLYWLLSTIDLRKNDSSTAQPVISGSKIYELEIPLPPFAEQQRIVNVIESLFEKLDAAKELAQNALDSFENHKAAILHKAFTGELTAKWREDNGVSLDEWEERNLKSLCKISSGGTPSRKNDEYYTGEIAWVKTGEIKWNYIDDSEEKITECAIKNSSAKLFPIGTVLVAMYGQGLTRGRAAILDIEATTNQAVCALIPNSELLNKYLYYYFMCNYWILREKAVGGNQPNFSGTIIGGFIINTPTVREQKEIVSILDNLLDDEQRAKELCDVIEKIDLMKKAILARAFRGKLGTNDLEEESAVELLKEVLKEKI